MTGFFSLSTWLDVGLLFSPLLRSFSFSLLMKEIAWIGRQKKEDRTDPQTDRQTDGGYLNNLFEKTKKR